MTFSIHRRAIFGGLAGAAVLNKAANMRPAQVPPTTGSRDHPSLRELGVRGDGTTPDGAAIQAALDTFSTLWVPSGTYLIDQPLTLPSYSVLTFASDAIFRPARDGMTIFRTGEVSYGSRIVAPRIHANGRRGVTAFDLEGFRHRAEIAHADIEGCERGIVLRRLCWDTVLHMPWIRHTRYPIIVTDGSNAVDVIHPGIDGCDTGIRIAGGPEHPTTSVRVWGGYVQNGRVGISDEGAIGTIVDGTYFEMLTEADILLTKAMRSNLSRTQHFAGIGEVGIRMAEADSVTVFDPVMGSGERAIGLFDIDAVSRNATVFVADSSSTMNTPLGRIGSARRILTEAAGNFVPKLQNVGTTALRYERQEGRWRQAGGLLSVALDLLWNGATPGSPLTIVGFELPPGASAMVGAVGVANVGEISGPVSARLAPDGSVQLSGGDGAVIATPSAGSVSLMVTGLV